jgi:hypothetical protein
MTRFEVPTGAVGGIEIVNVVLVPEVAGLKLDVAP